MITVLLILLAAVFGTTMYFTSDRSRRQIVRWANENGYHVVQA